MIIVNCLECGKLFEVRISEINRGNGKFCSRECAYKSRSSLSKIELKRKFKCQQCGKDFYRSNSSVKKQLKLNHQIKYCSVLCLNASKKIDHGVGKCLNCGDEFIKKYTDQIYCSQHCSRTHVKFKDNANLRHRIKILSRDNYTCQYCGRSPRKEDDVILEIDHILPKAKGGSDDLNNLITSCSFCNQGKGDIIISKYK